MANIIFDYDGTLHESIHIYAPAFRKAVRYLASKHLMLQIDDTDQEIAKWLGYTAKDMWSGFAPHIPEVEQRICSQMIGEEMLLLLQMGKARLYPRGLETLAELKNGGHTLIFLSNCKIAYMEEHKKHFSLERYFDGFYCSEQFDFIPKYEIFEQVKKDFSGEFVVIGDRFADIEIGIKHNIKSIGCLYGYGEKNELCGADETVEDVGEILRLL